MRVFVSVSRNMHFQKGMGKATRIFEFLPPLRTYLRTRWVVFVVYVRV